MSAKAMVINMLAGKRLLILLLSALVMIPVCGCSFSGEKIGDIIVSKDDRSVNDISLPNTDNKNTADYKIPESVGFYLNKLTDDQKNVYLQIYKGIMNYDAEININTGVLKTDQVSDFLTFLTSTAAHIHQVSGEYGIYSDDDGYATSIKFNYSRDKSQGDKELKQLETEVKKLVQNTIAMTDFEKLKYFHDQIVQQCEYNKNGSNSYSAYGCLVDKKAVCEGYSKAMVLLCREAEIPCLTVIGEAKDENGTTQSHMWNMVKLQGKWYHMDVTWDDPHNDFGGEYVRYDYFNVNDDMIFADHTAKTTDFMQYPKADAVEENYFVKNGLYVYDDADGRDLVERAVEGCVLQSGQYVRVRCQSKDKFNSLIKNVFDETNGSFFEILHDVSDNLGINIAAEQYAIAKNPYALVITVQLKK